MRSNESAAQDAGRTRTYAGPTPNPLIIVSDRSSRLMVIVLVSCALTIAVTRLFLVLTGYPQIGGSTFHLPRSPGRTGVVPGGHHVARSAGPRGSCGRRNPNGSRVRSPSPAVPYAKFAGLSHRGCPLIVLADSPVLRWPSSAFSDWSNSASSSAPRSHPKGYARR
jgi:hypothetical protein